MCRLLPYSAFSLHNQTGAFSSGGAENHERSRNKGGDCKAPDGAGDAKENPGELAGSTGANTQKSGMPTTYSDGGAAATPKPGHALIGEAVIEALGELGADRIAALSTVMQVFLTRREIGGLAWAFVRALDAEDAEAVFEAVHGGAGAPLPPFGEIAFDAEHWASGATEDELRAYAVAIFRAMSGADRRAFLDYAGRAQA